MNCFMIPSSTASCPPARGGLTMVGMIISNLLVSPPGSSRVWGGGGGGGGGGGASNEG